jgi:hypothetical protein
VLAAIAAICGCAIRIGSASVHVVNDSDAGVRIASCVDDSQDVAPHGQFEAEGVPSDGHIFCLVTTPNGRQACVAISTHPPTGSAQLSRGARVRSSHCY